MYTLNDAFAYYWRVFSNFELGAAGVFGFLHLISLSGLLTFVMLSILSVLIFKANPQKNKNRFMAMMLLIEGVNAGILTLFWMFPWPPEAIPYLFPFRGVVLILTIIRIFLYLSAPAFYLEGKWANEYREVLARGMSCSIQSCRFRWHSYFCTYMTAHCQPRETW